MAFLAWFGLLLLVVEGVSISIRRPNLGVEILLCLSLLAETYMFTASLRPLFNTCTSMKLQRPVCPSYNLSFLFKVCFLIHSGVDFNRYHRSYRAYSFCPVSSVSPETI